MSLLLSALMACGADPEPPCTSNASTDQGCHEPAPRCGDAERSPAEACDDGINDGSYGGCMPDCTALAPRCGDASVTDREACDDGVNDGAYGGCTACTALAPRCGDGEITHDEVCDDTVNDGAYDGCLPGCVGIGPTCGDGLIQGSEACDDALNDGAYGGCDRCVVLAPHCGDGLVTDSELCDDALNDGSYGGCLPGCAERSAWCGDGVIDAAEGEACDDTVNDGRYGGCMADCTALGPFCGDGLPHPSEICDNGLNDGSYQGCMPYCDAVGPDCGDGNVDPEELCDDGHNTLFNGGCFPGCQTEDASEDIFDPGRFMTVEITLDSQDWDDLRTQTRQRREMFEGIDCLDEPWGSPFTFFPGEVTIDGVSLGTVGVRKKGFFGSLSESKPSLKLDFTEYDEDLLWRGQKRMALNNDIADTAHLKQCITFEAFRDQGLLAPRCSYARVLMNGEDLGVFTHVEVLKKRFFRYHLGNDSGNLYEGTLSDFSENFITTFEQDLNEGGDPSRDDLNAVLAAMQLDDTAFLAALEDLFVMDELYRFWALESLTAHWDGYTGNQNNFYLYADPDRGGRFVFVAWGADNTLLDRAGRPVSVQVMPALMRRIWAIPAGQDRYMATLDEALDAWDTTRLLASIDSREQTLLAAMTAEEAAELPALVQPVRDFVAGRVQLVDDAIAGGPEQWTIEERLNFCLLPVGTATVTVRDEHWSSVELGAWEECPDEQFDLTLDGVAVVYDRLRCRSGIHTNDRHYFQIIADDTVVRNVRYTFSMLFPKGEEHLFPQVVETFTTPWHVSISEYDLTAGETIRNMEITGGTITVLEYPLLDDQPAALHVAGDVLEWDR